MISIVIPLYNEENNIDQLWQSLTKLERCEMIFVDGGSTDQTVEKLRDFVEQRNLSESDLHETSKKQPSEKIASSNIFSESSTKNEDKKVENAENENMWITSSSGHRVLLLRSQEKGRSNQMNYGASFASGDLFFLHADSIVPKTAISDIESVLQKYSAGCFRLRFEPETFLLFFCGRLSGWRVISRKIMFGDQGIFIQKELFESLGGFAKIPLMEDYELSIRLKQKGITIGRTKSILTTSARRFLDNGTIRTMIKMQILQHKFRRGVDATELYKRY